MDNEDHSLDFGATAEETPADLDLDAGNLAKVRDFFRKNKPPPKPAPPQPTKKWLLQMLPDPEELLEKEEGVPPVGDVEAERKWLNFGNQPKSRQQELISQTTEYRQLARDIQYEMDPRRIPLPRTTARSKYIRSFRGNTVPLGWKERIDRPGVDAEVMHEYWLEQGHEKRQSSATNDYSELDKHFERLPLPLQPTEAEPVDGVVENKSVMKENRTPTRFQQFSLQEKSPPASQNPSLSYSHTSREKLPKQIPAEGGRVVVAAVDEEKSKANEIYQQITMETVSETVHDATDGGLSNEEGDLRHSKWLDQTVGESAELSGHEEYNDFKPEKALENFANEYSSDLFKELMHDLSDTVRQKLYGDENWMACSMSTAKYICGDIESNNETAVPKLQRDPEPKIPRHIINKGDQLAELVVAETKEYPDFYKTAVPRQSRRDAIQMHWMRRSNSEYTKNVPATDGRQSASSRSQKGYSFSKKQNQTVDRAQKNAEIEERLFEGAYERGSTDDSLFSVHWIMDTPETALGYEHCLKLEKFGAGCHMPLSPKKRVEEVKLLEGSPERETLNEEEVALIEALGNESTYHEQIESRELHRLMEAESRYRDQFSNEASDQLPDLKKARVEQLAALRRRREPESQTEWKSSRQHVSISKADFDPWLLKELEKYKKNEGEKYDDLFSLAIHPRMLEAAFASLRRRRPGSVPRAVENNFFELASRLLSTGDLRPDIAATPKKPPKYLGKGARSTRIPSHHIKRIKY